jgi:hypothetical protein
MMPIPGINFSKAANFCVFEGLGRFFSASPGVKRLGLAVAIQGSILNIAPVAPNVSYTQRFFGPTIHCPDANETAVQQINSAATGLGITPDNHPYIAFVPSGNVSADLELVVGANRVGTPPPVFDFVSTDYARIFVAVSRSALEQDQYQISECGLYNTSYEVDFRFDNGIQLLDIRNFTYLNGIPYLTDIGYITSNNQTIVEVEQQHLSYQAIMESLGNILVGNCVQPASAPLSGQFTQILSTVLVNAQEIHQIELLFGAGQDTSWGRNFTLAEGIEELSRNITLSLLSSPTYMCVYLPVIIHYYTDDDF